MVKRAQKRKAKHQENNESSSPIKCKLRRSSSAPELGKAGEQTCFFCGGGVQKDFHRASTFNLDAKVSKMATDLRDSILLAKLSTADMTASDAVCHKKCLTSLHTRNRSLQCRQDVESTNKLKPESIALAELVPYIGDMEGAGNPNDKVFKFYDLVKLYSRRLEQLGVDKSK